MNAAGGAPATSIDASYYDTDKILRQAAATFFDHLSEMCEGILLVDREARLVWINDRYERYLGTLGFSSREQVLGRPIEEVVPNTLMRSVVETGRPILIDVIENPTGTFVVSRIPLHDDDGRVIGAIGMILYDQIDSLKPILGRLSRLQTELTAARQQLARQRRTRYTFSNFVGNSPAALNVKSRARRAAVLNTTVLLVGETGTGKELVAQAIHAASARASRPFIAINVAAIPETLLEAEFFGVAPGAYTGAERRGRDGKLALADTGTLFLDEIADMPLALQAKLLRVLQEREFEPLGSNRMRQVDIRVIAATSVDLGERVAEGRFRSDLYYRLNVLPIRLPPLRERRSDLEALCEYLLEQLALEHEMLPKELDADALALLEAYDWPGNVRELRNVLERACSFWDGLRLSADAVAAALPAGHADRVAASGADAAPDAPAPENVTAPGAAGAPSGNAAAAEAPGTDRSAPGAPSANGEGATARAGAHLIDESLGLPEQVARLERAAIAAALRACGGNRAQAARRLGIARATLYQKLAAWPDLVEEVRAE